MQKLIVTLFLLIPLSILYAQDTINVPGDYTTIQEGIDSANNGDIVLVAEDTYYENIDFKGKAITVASHFLVDEDTSHISNTIIDGSQHSHPDSGTVVMFKSGEDTNSVLCGFTITGGTGTIKLLYRGGGGIFCINSGARIEFNQITNNTVNYSTQSSGGGICVDGTNNEYVIIQENQITDNSVNGGSFGAFGGGIEFINSSGKVVNNLVTNNTCVSSGSQANSGGMGFWSNNPIKPFIIITDNEVSYNTVTGFFTSFEGALAAGLGLIGCNGLVLNNKVTHNTVNSTEYATGSGIYCQDADDITLFDGNYIANNTFGQGICWGGGLLIFNSAPGITNNIIENNTATEGAGIYFESSNTSIINNTIINNTADEYGGGIRSENSQTNIMNTILWGNSAPADSQISGSVNVVYSDVEGSWDGVGNINVNPSFSDTLFHLSDLSPCIQTAIDSIDITGTWYYCPPLDIEGYPRPYPVGTMPDMGAYEYQFLVGVNNDISQLPEKYSLAQNYPNPFNPTTTIVYGLRERSNVELKVFDVLGREIEIVVNSEQPAGYYEVEFNASRLASGIYFYRLHAGDFVEAKKMILLK